MHEFERVIRSSPTVHHEIGKFRVGDTASSDAVLSVKDVLDRDALRNEQGGADICLDELSFARLAPDESEGSLSAWTHDEERTPLVALDDRIVASIEVTAVDYSSGELQACVISKGHLNTDLSILGFTPDRHTNIWISTNVLGVQLRLVEGRKILDV